MRFGFAPQVPLSSRDGQVHRCYLLCRPERLLPRGIATGRRDYQQCPLSPFPAASKLAGATCEPILHRISASLQPRSQPDRTGLQAYPTEKGLHNRSFLMEPESVPFRGKITRRTRPAEVASPRDRARTACQQGASLVSKPKQPAPDELAGSNERHDPFPPCGCAWRMGHARSQLRQEQWLLIEWPKTEKEPTNTGSPACRRRSASLPTAVRGGTTPFSPTSGPHRYWPPIFNLACPRPPRCETSRCCGLVSIVRTERHNPHSVAGLRLQSATHLARSLAKCPCCLRHIL